METGHTTQSVSKRSRLILVSLWGFILGILVSSLVHIVPILSVFIALLACAILGIEKLRDAEASQEVMLLVFVLFSFSLGSFRYSIKDFHVAQVPSVSGIVVSEPEYRDRNTRFVYEADNGERVLVSTDMYSTVTYGDRVRISGKFQKPGIIQSENGREFNYAAYLSRDDIYHTMNYAKVEIISRGHGNPLLSVLLKIKSEFIRKTKEILPEPESSLLAGLIVAGKQALPESLLENFKNAGVVHIVVLSGYNVTIIAEFFLMLLVALSLRTRMAVAGASILLFVLMAGANPSIVRAGIMAIAVLLGKVIHRPYSVSRALLLAATIMLFFNPKLLVFDPSFQLSFIAMLALIYIEPIISPRLKLITEKFGLRTLLSATLATQIAVLPYFLYSTGSVSIVSLISNALVLLIVPLTMLVGFLAVLLAFISTAIAWPLAYISHWCLSWMLGVAQVFGNLSFSNIKVSHFPLWLTFILYSILALIIVRSRNSLQQSAN